jgi:hypothetical protein
VTNPPGPPPGSGSVPTGARDGWNGSRWPTDGGHYESWFVRANHPTRPLGFWIRYTIFAPAGAPERTEAELWATWFDGERERVAAAKSERTIANDRFARQGLDISIDGSTLRDSGLEGTCVGFGHRLAWRLRMSGGTAPLLLLPTAAYARSFPRAKVVVPRPACRFEGTVEVDGESMPIDGWLGSQNHNWGPAHTERYAWGQVAGFDGREDAFLECSSARLRLGPLLTPWLTLAVLRLGDDDIVFNGIGRAPLARATVDGLGWSFRTSNGRDRLAVTIRGEPQRAVGLTYRNPSGGSRVCVNTKIAACDLRLSRAGTAALHLRAGHRAALELLGLGDVGVPVSE